MSLNQRRQDHSRRPPTPSKGHTTSDSDSDPYQSEPDLHIAPSSPMASANLDPFFSITIASGPMSTQTNTPYQVINPTQFMMLSEP